MALKLKVIIGSTRPGRIGPSVGKWAADLATEFGGFDVELVDLKEIGLPLLDEANHPRAQAYEHDHTKRWAAIIEDADALVFVTPEYDFYPPASLVNAVQTLAVEWQRKPAAVVGYGGVSGGMRAMQELRMLLGNLNMMAIPQSVPVPFVFDYLGEDGTLRPTEPVNDGMKAMYTELKLWAEALATLRTKAA